MSTTPNLAVFRSKLAAALRAGTNRLDVQKLPAPDPFFGPAPPRVNPTPIVQNQLRAILGSVHSQIVAARSAGPLYDLVDTYLDIVAQLAATLPQSTAPVGSVLGAAMTASSGPSSWQGIASAGGIADPRRPPG